MSGHQEDKRQLALKTLALFKKMLCEMDYTNAAGTRIEDFEAIGVPGQRPLVFLMPGVILSLRPSG